MSRTVEVSEEARVILTRWYGREILDATPVLRGSLFGWLFGASGQHAVTINRTVHLTRHAPDPDTPAGITLLGHELYHVEQQIELGWWKFLFRYIVGWRPSHISNGRGHSMERPAYERGDEIRQAMQPMG